MRKIRILAVLLALSAWIALPVRAALPGETSSNREIFAAFKKQAEDCRSHLTALGKLLKAWRQQYQASLGKDPKAAEIARHAVPSGINLAGLCQLLALDKNAQNLLHCPGSRIKAPRRNGRLDESHNCYYYMGNLDTGAGVADASIPLIFDKPGTRHVCVLFRDGHVETLGNYGRDKSCSAQELIQILDRRFQYPADLKKKLLAAAAQLDANAGVKIR